MGQYNLALMYAFGMGIDKDAEQSLFWLHAASRQGMPRAQFFLARMYHEGDGTDKNLIEAYRWYQQASIGGDADAFEALQEIKKEMTSEQLSIAQQNEAPEALAAQ
jgi:TPR repeat protein